jgi:hypothetical protein
LGEDLRKKSGIKRSKGGRRGGRKEGIVSGFVG